MFATLSPEPLVSLREKVCTNQTLGIGVRMGFLSGTLMAYCTSSRRGRLSSMAQAVDGKPGGLAVEGPTRSPGSASSALQGMSTEGGCKTITSPPARGACNRNSMMKRENTSPALSDDASTRTSMCSATPKPDKATAPKAREASERSTKLQRFALAKALRLYAVTMSCVSTGNKEALKPDAPCKRRASSALAAQRDGARSPRPGGQRLDEARAKRREPCARRRRRRRKRRRQAGAGAGTRRKRRTPGRGVDVLGTMRTQATG
mmetsp:Transcript_65625/g.145209  ORF Transcript_65625/g.145209 Transcript_65625/m.145209 type:complete len:262 (-) Transcript_65625:1381-2166(-)